MTSPLGPSAVNFRRATGVDVSALCDLASIVQGLHVERRPDSFVSVSVGELRSYFDRVTRGESLVAYLAEADRQPVGYLLASFRDIPANPFNPSSRICELEQLAVLPLWRRRGVARGLCHTALQEALIRHVDRVETTCWAFNAEAQALVRGLGFSVRTVHFEMLVSGR